MHCQNCGVMTNDSDIAGHFYSDEYEELSLYCTDCFNAKSKDKKACSACDKIVDAESIINYFEHYGEHHAWYNLICEECFEELEELRLSNWQG